jgi:hypothetical protein
MFPEVELDGLISLKIFSNEEISKIRKNMLDGRNRIRK